MFAKKILKKGMLVAGAFACMAAFSLFGKIDANAATAVTDLKQSDDGTNSVKVEWNGALDDKNYYVEISEDQQNWMQKIPRSHDSPAVWNSVQKNWNKI